MNCSCGKNPVCLNTILNNLKNLNNINHVNDIYIDYNDPYFINCPQSIDTVHVSVAKLKNEKNNHNFTSENIVNITKKIDDMENNNILIIYYMELILYIMIFFYVIYKIKYDKEFKNKNYNLIFIKINTLKFYYLLLIINIGLIIYSIYKINNCYKK